MSFFEAVGVCLGKYATFSGRASRAEYWWFMLFIMLCAMIINAIVAPFAGANAGASVASVFLLAMLVPTFAVGARRLHDMNSSGWWQLLHFTGIGALALTIWMIFPGTLGANRFGQPVVPALEDEA
jgi:uncharacterized membrane protein YhaH (DUF805 family)